MFTQDTLAGKHALVLGSSQGIGRACAIALAETSCRVTVVARSEEKLAKVLELLGPGKHQALVCDLSQPQAVDRLIQQLKSDIDIIVNNSGGPKPGLLSEADPQELVDAFYQHVIASQKILQACLNGMKERGFGRVINIISTSVKAPLPGLGVSNTIRGAMANWSKTLANELGSFGITVNNILPGFTETDRLESIIEKRQKSTKQDRQQVVTAMQSQVPVRRFAKPEELAQACVFLASHEASYINGINLPVDGGRTDCL